MNKSLLRSIMILNGDTNTSLAKYLGIAKQTFSSKINQNNGADFSQDEIMQIKDKYKLSPDEIDKIFFNKEVSKKDI